ncbi:response regulator transcription factor [Aliivibrio sp. EL58]|uniref:response regulator transcription factor n=1 Tax=Aliivibrio sp. EL58 TaxID=2107582 RepID=UPI000EFB3191|nr:response regulator transcription factor [Aliivibrio sp. EL58]
MPSSFKVNALILDTFPIIVESITRQLKSKENIEQIYTATTMQKALTIIKENNIGFIALDIKQNQFNGLDFIKRLRSKNYQGYIIVISSYGYEMYSDSAKNVGANGYISKEEPTELINDAISNILRGYSIFKHTSLSEKNMDLSNREVIVLDYLIRGYNNKQISEILSLSAKTISTYKSRILDKYNAGSIIELLNVNNSIKEAC